MNYIFDRVCEKGYYPRYVDDVNFEISNCLEPNKGIMFAKVMLISGKLHQ